MPVYLGLNELQDLLPASEGLNSSRAEAIDEVRVCVVDCGGQVTRHTEMCCDQLNILWPFTIRRDVKLEGGQPAE